MVGIFFGSFDPPHIGHVNVVTAALNSGKVDKVIVVPAYKSVWKNTETKWEYRLAMAKETFDNIPGVVVDAPTISRVRRTDNGARFVVAECEGADRMAQDYLLACGVAPIGITVYHMLKSPRYLANESIRTVGGFTSDTERDEAMTRNSDYDIAFIRKGKETSGTAQNILRRWTK